jgi:hypothetical protein
MNLIHYKPEVLANELFEISKKYHLSKVKLLAIERRRKKTEASNYLRFRNNGKTAKDAEMQSKICREIEEIDTELEKEELNNKELFSQYESKLIEIDLIRSHNSTTKEELKLAQINENVIRKANEK